MINRKLQTDQFYISWVSATVDQFVDCTCPRSCWRGILRQQATRTVSCPI